METRAVVLHSGGLDSTVCLLLARELGRKVISLGIEYGQRHHIELDYAAAQCKRFEVERRVLTVKWDKPERPLPTNRAVKDLGKSVSPAFLPARNGLFLMLGCAEAAGVGATEIWTGINSINFSGYPDCTPEFLDAFKNMIRIGVPKGPIVLAPLLKKSKPQIARIASRFGLGSADTWSCYRPQIGPNGFGPCGACDACVLHDYAWASPGARKRLRVIRGGHAS